MTENGRGEERKVNGKLATANQLTDGGRVETKPFANEERHKKKNFYATSSRNVKPQIFYMFGFEGSRPRTCNRFF
jgi:hypothetical protein